MSSSSKNRQSAYPALLVADPHALMCEAIANAARDAGYSDVRSAVSVPEIFRRLLGWRPGLILLDLSLVSSDNFEMIPQLQSSAPAAPIVVMMREHEEESDLIVNAFMKGAMGLASKDRGVASLLKVLGVVSDGEAAIPRSLATSIVKALRMGPALMENQARLSSRQREVLTLVAEGLSDREISERLQIGLPTVRSHIDAIFEKTNTTNRTAAARWASTMLPEAAATNHSG